MAAHADLALDCQVPEAAGHRERHLAARSRWGGGRRRGSAGRIVSDGKSLLPLRGAVLQQRRRAGSDGSVVATLVVDRRGWLAAPPPNQPARPCRANAEPAAALQARWPTRWRGSRRRCGMTTRRCAETARRVLRRGLNERFGKRPLSISSCPSVGRAQ